MPVAYRSHPVNVNRIRCMGGGYVLYSYDSEKALVNTVMNLWMPQKAGYALTI
jgi:hypothetical protein